MSKITLYELRRGIKPRDYYEEGRLFEQYIKKLFNEDRFKLKRWRRSFDIPIDTFIGDLSGPDLELIFQHGSKKPFAIECKYRTRFYNGSLRWASENQIKRYEEFQNKKAMTVLVAIGVGGTPSNPRTLFMTPLDNIKKQTHVFRSQLITLEKNAKTKTVDAEQLELFASVEYILQKHQVEIQNKAKNEVK